MRSREIRDRLKDIEEFLLSKCKENGEEGEGKLDWKTYEQQLASRIKKAVRNLEPLIEEAVRSLETSRGRGRRPGLELSSRRSSSYC